MAIKQKKHFKFGKPALRQPLPKQSKARAPKLKNPEDQPPFYIRGIKAGSKEEYWCGLFLEEFELKTGITWEYQVDVYGGRSRRGGNVVDFLVHTPVMETMLEPMGRPWHTGHREDRSQMQNVARKKQWKLIAWFTDQYPTREETWAFLWNQFNVYR